MSPHPSRRLVERSCLLQWIVGGGNGAVCSVTVVVGGIDEGIAVGDGTTVSAVAVKPVGRALKLAAECSTECVCIAVTIVDCGCEDKRLALAEASDDACVKGA